MFQGQRDRRQRLLALTGALVAIPVTLLTAGASARRTVTPPPTAQLAAWSPEIVTISGPGFPVPYGHYVVAPNPAEVETQLAAQRSIRYALPPGRASERGMQVKTILVERAISAAFPEIYDIGGVRPDTLRWHPDGLAIDVMIPNYGTPAGKDLGDRVAEFAYTNAARLGVIHIIWQQTFFPIGGGAPYRMPNLGSDDANHYTHVHIATEGGGYPTGTESYFGGVAVVSDGRGDGAAGRCSARWPRTSEDRRRPTSQPRPAAGQSRGPWP